MRYLNKNCVEFGWKTAKLYVGLAFRELDPPETIAIERLF